MVTGVQYNVNGINTIYSSDLKYRLVEMTHYRSPYSPYTILDVGSLYTTRRHRRPSVALLNEEENALGALWDEFFRTEGNGLPLLYTGQTLEQLSTNKNGFHFHQDRFFIFLGGRRKILVAREDIRHLKRFRRSTK